MNDTSPPQPAESHLAAPPAQEGILLSVIIPTFNEAGNITILVDSVLSILSSQRAEVLVVDDNSPDGTAEAVRSLSNQDHRVRLLSRPRKMGLASAVFFGADAAKGVYVCTMDADLSHDPEELPRMLALAEKGMDVVIGSRFIPGAAFVHQPPPRQLLSRAINASTRGLLRLKPTDVLTGYVLCKRSLITGMQTRYSGNGFKFLAELLATTPDLQVAEVPIRFHERRSGRSKASLHEAAQF
ncbi:MAG: polyprenol monophosphomannose synthase, partial [Dehalococcoidia bacterium]